MKTLAGLILCFSTNVAVMGMSTPVDSAQVDASQTQQKECCRLKIVGAVACGATVVWATGYAIGLAKDLTPHTPHCHLLLPNGLQQPCVSTQPSVQWNYIQATLKYMKAHSNKTCVPACISQISGPPGLPVYNREYPIFPVGYGKESALPLLEVEHLFQGGNETYLYAVCEVGERSWVSRVKEYLKVKGLPFWATKTQESEGILFPQELEEYVIDEYEYQEVLNSPEERYEFVFSVQDNHGGVHCQ